MAKSNSRLVYTSETGRICPECGNPTTSCRCHAPASGPRGDGIVRVGRSTAGRKGKGVTVISGVPLEGDALKALAKKLKQRCGSGGTVKDGVIEIQGEHRDMLVELLKKEGWTVRKSGG